MTGYEEQYDPKNQQSANSLQKLYNQLSGVPDKLDYMNRILLSAFGPPIIKKPQDEYDKYPREALSYQLLDVPVSDSGATKEYQYAGNYLYILNPDVASTCTIKLDNETNATLDLSVLRSIAGPFNRFFITFGTLTDTLHILVGRQYGFGVQPITQVVAPVNKAPIIYSTAFILPSTGGWTTLVKIDASLAQKITLNLYASAFSGLVFNYGWVIYELHTSLKDDAAFDLGKYGPGGKPLSDLTAAQIQGFTVLEDSGQLYLGDSKKFILHGPYHYVYVLVKGLPDNAGHPFDRGVPNADLSWAMELY